MNIKNISKEDQELINEKLEEIRKNESEFSCFQYFFELVFWGICAVLMILFPWVFLLKVEVPIIRWFGFALPLSVIYCVNKSGKKPKRLSYVEKSKNVIWAMEACISIIENSGLIRTNSGIVFFGSGHDERNSDTYKKFISYFPEMSSLNLRTLSKIKWE